ncbi:Fic family protein [Candidatus Rariloculus sp.]|uniref:Fic family protein n=1 Tax=Candidatus Rariloculus sp. TaxID=3101265 RepID=UPI003D126644
MPPSEQLSDLPPSVDLETRPVLKALSAANRALGELKGRAATIPNPGILVDTLTLQEARASSEIENIVTTQDELFQAQLFPQRSGSAAAKEVGRYSSALKLGFERLRQRHAIITNNDLIDMFRLLKMRQNEGFRSVPGTVLRHEGTGQVVYEPPQDAREIVRLMGALETFINDDSACSLDPLIKMALIHHQFESIHPFSDGNGRVGRILNVLYLTKTGLLEAPTLYLSRYITQHKDAYYRLLQSVRTHDTWEEWVLYMLAAVTETAEVTLRQVSGIRDQMADVKRRMRTELPRIYSQEMLNNLFRHPYTRIGFVVNDLGVTRQTAAKRLKDLAAHGFVTEHRAGRSSYYVNDDLVGLFLTASHS